MREALARSRHDFKLSARPETGWEGRGGRLAAILRGTARLFLRQLRARPATTIASATFAALMTGITLNALVLQNVRHPAPLFGRVAPKPAAPVPHVAAAASRIAAAPPHPAAAADQDQIAQLLKGNGKSHAEAGPESPGKDPIAQLLKGQPSSSGSERATERAPEDAIGQFLRSEPDKGVLNAQRALVKLGYATKVDGILGSATRSAIERFERDHHLPVKGELTQRVQRELAVASGISAD